MRFPHLGIALASVLALACDHADPFGFTPERNDGPLQPGTPARLTHNVGQDIGPSWLPDGSGILYTFEKSRVENGDRCLAVIPAGGGTRLAEICNTSVGHLDSTEAYGPAAVSHDGRLAYGYAQSTPLRLAPNVTQLRVAQLSDPQSFSVVHTLPLDADGTKVDGIGELHWLSDTRLVYLAQSVVYSSPVPGAARDTIINGIAVALVDLQNFPRPTLIPGTEGATAVSPGNDPETIVYTLAGDSRVYLKELATGSTTMLHDFGALGIARDASLQGNRLVAVVGGFVTFSIDPQMGGSQKDLGGPIYQVDLASGQERLLPEGSTPRLFRHPTISDTGDLAAEGYVLVPAGGVTFVDPFADVMLFPAP